MWPTQTFNNQSITYRNPLFPSGVAAGDGAGMAANMQKFAECKYSIFLFFAFYLATHESFVKLSVPERR